MGRGEEVDLKDKKLYNLTQGKFNLLCAKDLQLLLQQQYLVCARMIYTNM